MTDRNLAIALTLFVSAMLLGLFAFMAGKPVQRDRIAGTQPITYRIDPNTANTETLCILPMVGPGNAQRIVDDRAINGPFRNAQEMQRVPFVGKKTVIAIEPWVVFEPSE